MIECKLCKKWFKAITPTHLKIKHNLTIAEYDAPRYTSETIEKLRTKPQWNTGLTSKTDERIRKMSNKLLGRPAWNAGLTTETDEHLKTVGLNRRGKKGQYLACDYCDKKFYRANSQIKSSGGHHKKNNYCSKECKYNASRGFKPWNKDLNKENSDKIKALSIKLSEAHKNNPKYIWSVERKKKWNEKMKPYRDVRQWTEEQRKHMSMISANQRKWHSISKPELKIKGILNLLELKENIDYFHNKGIKLLTDRWKRPDFRLELDKTIIEYDGKYWHPEGNEKDKQRNLEYEKLGYTLYILNEDDELEMRVNEIVCQTKKKRKHIR